MQRTLATNSQCLQLHQTHLHQVNNGPVYKVCPESGGRTRILHRNLLHLVNDSSVPSEPFKAKNLPVHSPLSSQANVRKGRKRGRNNRYQNGTAANRESSDSDEGEDTGYWLRTPVRKELTSEPAGPSQESGGSSTHPLQPKISRSVPEDPTFNPGQADEGVELHVVGSQELDRPIPPQSPVDQRGHTPRLVENVSSALHTRGSHSSQPFAQSDTPTECGTAVRKSTRSINPIQRFTYETLGDPSYQSHGRVSVIRAYIVPRMPVWGIQSQHIPHHCLALPNHWFSCTPFVPCNIPVQVY